MASDVRMAGLISGKPGILVFHLGREKEQLDLIFQVLKGTDIPIKHFRPTHAQKVLEQAIDFAKMGGYIDFTASSGSSAAGYVVSALRTGVDPGRITLSTDSNGSLPRWNDKNEMIGLSAAVMTTLHETVRNLILEQKVDIPTALAFATQDVAEALEIGAHKGSVRPGLDADILLLDEQLNPGTVMARGKVMMWDGQVQSKATFER